MPDRSDRAAMTVRDKAQDRAYVLSFLAGSRSYRVSLPRMGWAAVLCLLPLTALLYLGATAYWIFRDDILTSLMQRQVDMHYSYEDRIGLLRHEMETLLLRARTEQARCSGDLQNLQQRQIEVENRTALLLTLSERVKALRPNSEPKAAETVTTKAANQPGAAGINPLLSGFFAPHLPQASSAYAPLQHPLAAPAPRPEPLDLRQGNDIESRNEEAAPLFAVSEPQPIPDSSAVAAIYDRLDGDELRIIANMIEPANHLAKDIRAALATAGLSAEDFARENPSAHTIAKGKASAMGGPFIPAAIDTSETPFTRNVHLLEQTLEASESLRRLLPQIPLRQPLYGTLEVASGFGPRVDPFFGRAAMHTGVDFVDDIGATVHATAKGIVIFAGPNGGYGNMVEIDHGNGLTTRYAHLSAIEVSLDQPVEAGTIVGKIGSTGRSTGPHLHYETRIDGVAVDPERFLKAGAFLFAKMNPVAPCAVATCIAAQSSVQDE